MSKTENHLSSKRSKTGDGHTMTKVDVHNELAKQEHELITAHKGLESSCGKCGESFKMSNLNNTLRDAINLDEHLMSNCPACNSWKTPLWHSKRNDLLLIKFKVGEKEIETLRIPMGYKAKKILKVDEKGRTLL